MPLMDTLQMVAESEKDSLYTPYLDFNGWLLNPLRYPDNGPPAGATETGDQVERDRAK